MCLFVFVYIPCSSPQNHLNKTCILVTPANMPTCMGENFTGPYPQIKSYRLLRGCELVSSRDKNPLQVIQSQRTSPNHPSMQTYKQHEMDLVGCILTYNNTKEERFMKLRWSGKDMDQRQGRGRNENDGNTVVSEIIKKI